MKKVLDRYSLGLMRRFSWIVNYALPGLLFLGILGAVALSSAAGRSGRAYLAACERISSANYLLKVANLVESLDEARETAARDYILTGDTATLSSYAADGRALSAQLAILDTLSKSENYNRPGISFLVSSLGRKSHLLDSLVALDRSGNRSAAMALLAGKSDETIEGPEEAIRTIETAQLNEFDRIKEEGANEIGWSHNLWAVIILLPLFMLSLAVYAFKLAHDELRKKDEELLLLNATLEQKVNDRTDELENSRREYRGLFQNNPLPMWVISLDTAAFLDVNEAALDGYGYTREEFLSMTAFDIRPVEERARFAAIDRSQPKAQSKGIWKHCRKDGSIIHAEIHASSISFQGTEARLILSQDITARKEAEEALMKSEANLQAVFESTETGFVLVDRSLQVVAFNQRIEKFVRRNPMRDRIAGGTSSLDYVPEKRRETVRLLMEKALTGEDIRYEVSYPGENEATTWYYISLLPVKGPEDDIIGLTIGITDISRRKRYEEGIKALNDSLETKVRERTEELEAFSYSVSHDLRTPLRIIRGYGELLMRDSENKFPEEDKKYIELILKNARRMGQLIDDLLNFSRLGNSELNRSPVSMTWLVETVIEELRISQQQMPDIVVADLGEVDCDPNLLRQVWQNLISNAVKYSAKNDKAKIEIGITDHKGKLTYFIRDNGAGFDMKYSDKLFGVFQRLHTADYEGTGVGLALTKRIIAKHGGSIWADAKVGEGATFYFQLSS